MIQESGKGVTLPFRFFYSTWGILAGHSVLFQSPFRVKPPFFCGEKPHYTKPVGFVREAKEIYRVKRY